MSLDSPNYLTNEMLEESQCEVDVEYHNILLKDRTNCEMLVSLDILLFGEYIIKHPSYGQKIYESENAAYELLIETGMDLKPILYYSENTTNIKIVGFCDNENLQIEEKSSLEEKVKVILIKNLFDS